MEQQHWLIGLGVSLIVGFIIKTIPKEKITGYLKPKFYVVGKMVSDLLNSKLGKVLAGKVEEGVIVTIAMSISESIGGFVDGLLDDNECHIKRRMRKAVEKNEVVKEASKALSNMSRVVIIGMLILSAGCSKKAVTLSVISHEPVKREQVRTKRTDDAMLEVIREKLVAEDKALEIRKTVYFPLNSHTPYEESLLPLKAALTASDGFTEIVVYGGCCPLGSESYNLRLGLERAMYVKSWLASRLYGVTIRTVSWGESNLVCEDDTNCYYQNRRCEVVIR